MAVTRERRRRARNAAGKSRCDEEIDAGNVTQNSNKRNGHGTIGSSRSKRRPKREDASEASKSKRDSRAPLNDDVSKVKTAINCAQRWEALFVARGNRKNSTKTPFLDSNNDVDAFDCSDLIVPPSFDLVNREVEQGIDRWKDLASRVIIEEDGPIMAGKTDEDNGEIPLRNSELLLDATHKGDKRKQRLLPHNFDYECKKTPISDALSDGSEDNCDVHHCPRVISLLDPAKTLDYKDELSEVFKSVKTSDELEILHALNNESNIHETEVGENTRPGGNAAHGCQHSLAAQNQLREGFAKYSRLDAHSLGRLRIRDRAAPVCGAVYPSSSSVVHELEVDQINNRDVDNRRGLQTTIRFEILRHSQNLKRGSGPDVNRMEVELDGSQHTLLDLHRLLTECALNSESCTKGKDNVDVCAGIFLVENTFYTYGEAGDWTGKAIQHWLDGEEPGLIENASVEAEGNPGPADNQSEENDEPLPSDKGKLKATITHRRHFLGLSSVHDSIPMSKMKLEDMPLRLGVRYFHMSISPQTSLIMQPNSLWSLANESAMYVTGIHTHDRALVVGGENATQQNIVSNQQTESGINIFGQCMEREVKQSTRTRAPIVIHDTWAPPQRHYCHACNYSLASVVTVNDPLTDAAPPGLGCDSNRVYVQGVPMCSACYQALHYQRSNQRGGDNHSQPLLELRSGHEPTLAFPIEDYQRMAAASLDDTPKSIAF